MGFLSVILYIIYVLVCLFLIMVVLLQQGKGADLAGAFGGGGSQTSFGPRTSTNVMHRLTTISFVLFVVLSVTLAVRSGLERGESVVSDINEQPAVEETAALPAGNDGAAAAEAEGSESGAEAADAADDQMGAAEADAPAADPAAADTTANPSESGS